MHIFFAPYLILHCYNYCPLFLFPLNECLYLWVKRGCLQGCSLHYLIILESMHGPFLFCVCVVGDGILEYEQLLLNLLLCYRPFYAVCFLLPMLSQITMEIEGCKALASCKGLEAVSYFMFQFLYFLFYILYFSSLFSANFF